MVRQLPGADRPVMGLAVFAFRCPVRRRAMRGLLAVRSACDRRGGWNVGPASHTRSRQLRSGWPTGLADLPGVPGPPWDRRGMRVDVGAALPEATAPGAALPDVAGLARLAEWAGLDCLWAGDRLVAGQMPVLDASLVLAPPRRSPAASRSGFRSMCRRCAPLAWPGGCWRPDEEVAAELVMVCPVRACPMGVSLARGRTLDGGWPYPRRLPRGCPGRCQGTGIRRSGRSADRR
jgi:hypothetical protein